MNRLIVAGFLCLPLTVNCAEYDKIYKGRYVWGNETNVFQPCGDEKVYWVSASSWVKAPLLDFYKNNTTKPYQAVYVEFRGHILDEKVDGFAEDYEGLVRISEVMKQATAIPGGCN